MTEINPIQFSVQNGNSTANQRADLPQEALFNFPKTTNTPGLEVERQAPPPEVNEASGADLNGRGFPTNTNDPYAKQFAQYNADQCVKYIMKHAKYGKADINGLGLDAKRALCAIIAKAKSMGITVRVNTARRTREWQENARRRMPDRATTPDKSRHVKGDAFDLRFLTSNGAMAPVATYKELGNYAQNVLKMRYGGNCKIHTELWHFDYGNDRNDLFNP